MLNSNFQDICRIFKRVKARADRQTDRQTECIIIFQLNWKILKRFICFQKVFKRNLQKRSSLPYFSERSFLNLAMQPVCFESCLSVNQFYKSPR